jgi:hypothetical protein
MVGTAENTEASLALCHHDAGRYGDIGMGSLPGGTGADLTARARPERNLR